MISSTVLTLIVVPAIYSLVEGRWSKRFVPDTKECGEQIGAIDMSTIWAKKG